MRRFIKAVKWGTVNAINIGNFEAGSLAVQNAEDKDSGTEKEGEVLDEFD